MEIEKFKQAEKLLSDLEDKQKLLKYLTRDTDRLTVINNLLISNNSPLSKTKKDLFADIMVNSAIIKLENEVKDLDEKFKKL